MAVSGFFENSVVGALRAAGQILQWNIDQVSPSGWRHHESGQYKPGAKTGLVGGFTAQKESGIAIDFGQINIAESGFYTDTVALTFNLGEVNSNSDSFFNQMVANSSVATNFKAFNMRIWVGSLSAFSGQPQPTFYFRNSADWRRGYHLFPSDSGVSVLPSSMPTSQNVLSKGDNDVFVSGNFLEKQFSHFIYIRALFPSGTIGQGKDYALGTYGGLGQGDFTLKFSYDYTNIDSLVKNPGDLE